MACAVRGGVEGRGVGAALRAHQDHPVIAKLRHNQPLTKKDLTALEQILAESGAGGPDQIQMAASESQRLGMFGRWLLPPDDG